VDTYVTHSLRADGFDASEDGTGRGTPIVPVAFVASEQMNGFYSESDKSYTLNAQQASDSSNIQYGIRQGSTVRRLTPQECERLQGFPDGWTDVDGAKDGPRYKALGNAVTVPVIQYIGERIMAVLA
jgi:DNA (cytosine-5)-methyltransferase 1